MSIKIEDRPQTLTQGEIENFLQAAGTAGLRASTLRRYRSDLVALQHYLGAGACIRSGTLLQWVADMHAQGYAPRSIVARVLTVNRFLQYADRPDLCQEPPHYAPRPEPSLSWPEYQTLLATAQAQGREREALLMRVFVETGIPTKTLEQITAASLAAGYFITPEAKDVVRYPKDLRRALARYAAQNGIQSGPVFLSRGNKPASRSNMINDPLAQPEGDVSELLHYVDEIAVQSRYIGVTPQDKVIGLSTCAEAETNGRVVIFGRLDRMS